VKVVNALMRGEEKALIFTRLTKMEKGLFVEGFI